MESIGVLYNPGSERACTLAEEVAGWVSEQAYQVHVCDTDAVDQAPCLPEVELLVTLGGDGSILRAARAAAPHDALIFGVNLGRVGFLAEVEPDDWRAALSGVLAGDYWVESRLMLEATLYREGDRAIEALALNDVVVGRGGQARVVGLRTEIDRGYLTTFVADGLIIATPTGSTAYAMAAGGPVLPPELRNLLLVPVAPHLSLSRPIVLSEGVSVRVTVMGGYEVVLTVDGVLKAELEKGDEIEVVASPHEARFARLQNRTYFYNTLAERLLPRDHA